MKRILYLYSLLLILLGSAYAQNTTVTATVTDSDGVAWANGSWKIAFNPNSSIPTLNAYHLINGTSLSPSVINQSGSLDGSGALSVVIYDSSLITPAGSGWVLTVCPLASAPCGIYRFSTAGGAMNITSNLTAIIPPPRMSPGENTYGYDDREVQVSLNQGATYWNVNSAVKRFWNGATWVSGGSGTGTVNPGSSFRFAAYPSASAGTVNPTTNIFSDSTYSGVYIGGTAIPSGFTPGIFASQASYNPNLGIDVIAAGAKGDCVTDDHDAIVRAMVVATLNTSAPALPLYFPKMPGTGACYLTSTLPWQGFSLVGQTSSQALNIPVILKSMPGQDLWLFPDHTLLPPSSCSPAVGVPGCIISKSTKVEHMKWVVDDTVDASASHPHRKPGRTMNDAVTTAGSRTFTSAKLGCTAGDVGQGLLVTYPDTTSQSMVLTSCTVTNTGSAISYGTGLNGGLGTIMTMASVSPITNGNVSLAAGSNVIYIVPTTLANYSISTNTVTFKGTSLNFFAGQTVTLNGFTTSPANTWNGTTVTVLASGLTSGQFQATIVAANQGTTVDAGNAIPSIFPSNGQIALVSTFPANQEVTVVSGGGTNTLTLSASTNCVNICQNVFGSFYDPTTAQATESQTGVTTYLSLAGIPVTETIGNAALAIDDSTGGQVFAASLLSYARFEDFSILSSSGADSGNHTAAVFLQNLAGMPYGAIFRNALIQGTEYGFVYAPPDLNPQSANFGGDFMEFHSIKIGVIHPWIIYNGQAGKIDQIQVAGGGGTNSTTTGFQLLGAFTTNASSPPVDWDIKIPEMEQGPNITNLRLEGRDHVLTNTSTSGNAIIQWNASSSKCISCPFRGFSSGNPAQLLINGIQNDIELVDAINQVTISDDPSNGNRITGLRSTSTGAGPQVLKKLQFSKSRNCISQDLSADFLTNSPTASYYNRCDLWWWPQELNVSGTAVNVLPDSQSESGYYYKLTANNVIIGSRAWPSTKFVIGTNLPAKQQTIWIKHKCPVIGSYTITPGVTSLTALVLTQVTVSGGNAIYSYSSFTGPPPFIGEILNFTGLTNVGNKVTATITAISGGLSGTVTVPFTTQVNETHSGGSGGVISSFGAQTITCSAGYTTQSFAVDLTPYGGAVNNLQFTFAGVAGNEADIAWIGDQPYVSANQMATNGGIGQVFTQTGANTQGWSVSSGVVTAVPLSLQYYGDGSDGALNVAAGTTTIVGAKYYTTVNVSAGANLICTRAAPCYIYATTSITNAGLIAASALLGTANAGSSGAGNNGGSGGGSGGGTAAGTVGSVGWFVGGGGTAGAITGGAGGDATNGVSAANANGDGRKIILSGTSFSANIVNGGLQACGGGGTAGGSSGGAAGLAGCSLYLIAPVITLTGTEDVTGTAGTSSAANSTGAGSGGGGGQLIIRSPTLTDSSTKNLTGGMGGGCVNPAIVLTTPTTPGLNLIQTATTQAQAHVSTFAGGNPTVVTVDRGGAGYTFTPNCTVVGTGGGANTGASATCTATVAGGVVTGITVSGGNAGYGTGTTFTTCGFGGSGWTGWPWIFNQ